MLISLAELVDRFGGQLIGNGETKVAGFAPLDNADSSHITFLTNPRLRNEVKRSQAGALIISPKDNQLVGDLFRVRASSPKILTPISPMRRSCSKVSKPFLRCKASIPVR